MRIQSARDLKLEIAREVFAPIAHDLLERALKPRLGPILAALPLHRLALGIGRGQAPGEFTIAVRLQTESPILQRMVELVRARARGEVDVRFVGAVHAQDDPPETESLRKSCRPLVIGCSLAHVASTAGTLGLIARHRKSGQTVLLSNAHVLAQAGLAKAGDAITQPGRLDGGGAGDHVAALLDFAPLKMSDTASNQIDAAVAVVDGQVALTPDEVPGIGTFTVTAADDILPGTKVMKLGRTTGLTHGEILATELDDIVVDYGIAGTAAFDDQIEITGMPDKPFSDAGDSGSLVLDENKRAVGLIFCGNPYANDGRGVSYANHLPRVMAGLDLIPL
jgi:hypothetical protein